MLFDSCLEGRISWEQYKKELHQLNLSELSRLYFNKDWDGFKRIVSIQKDIWEDAFRLFRRKKPQVPEDVKHQLAMDCYLNEGDSKPYVRMAIRRLGKGNAVLPPELKDKEYITVFRAGEESTINEAKCRLSWTTSEKVANFFLSEYRFRHATHLWKGKIRPTDVIEYTNERKEQEILQYGSVYDIEDITPRRKESDDKARVKTDF